MLGAASSGPMQLRGRISVVPGGQDSPGLIDVARSAPGSAASSRRVSDAAHQSCPPETMIANRSLSTAHSPSPRAFVAELKYAAATDSSCGDCDGSCSRLEWDCVAPQRCDCGERECRKSH